MPIGVATKYYERIALAEAVAPAADVPPSAAFDFESLQKTGLLARLAPKALTLVLDALWACRIVFPRPRIPFSRYVVVMRHADVVAVLSDNERFETPFGREMRQLCSGDDFILGVGDPEHAVQLSAIKAAMPPTDLPRLARLCEHQAATLISAAPGRIDVIGDLFRRVAIEVFATYFGVPVADPEAFGDWTMALNNLLFADPTGGPPARAQALAAAARVRLILDSAIAAARIAPDSKTIIGRLVRLTNPALTDGQIRAIVLGLATGFVPTITLASSNILSLLMRRPKWMAAAQAAASLQDRGPLKAILLEAARLNPALQPGQWRYTLADARIGPKDGLLSRRVRLGDVIIVATKYALRDPRRFPDPMQMKPGRNPPPDIMFGTGMHWCLGTFVALTEMTEVFRLLLQQPNLRRAAGPAGALSTVGPYPRHLELEFGP